MSKKLTILYVLKILKDGTNKDHPIPQSTITKTINLMGIKCDRKTIARDINDLISYGYKIIKIKGGGCYYENSEFSANDIDNLLQGISLLNIDPTSKSELTKKVKKLININER